MRPFIRFIKVKDESRTAEKGYIDPELPSYATRESSGFDFFTIKDTFLEEGIPTLIPTGWRVELENNLNNFMNMELQIRPRSGLALKSGITILNTPGTIDQDYRGEIGIIAFWTGKVSSENKFVVDTYSLASYGESKVTIVKSLVIPKGTRIAQGVICPVYRGIIMEADEFKNPYSNTERGTGGFGSTGLE